MAVSGRDVPLRTFYRVVRALSATARRRRRHGRPGDRRTRRRRRALDVRWVVRPFDAAVVAQLTAANIPEVVARLLVQRGVESPEAAASFLHPKLEDLHSPYLMAGMERAVERLLAAIAKQ